jgi:MATE family multidrug resistance protein
MRWRAYWNREGGDGELLRLAWPLVVSNSFTTLQLLIDRMMMSWLSTDAIAASMPAAMLFWTLFILLQSTATYTTTFVAQYVGAGRPERVGPAVWQALYFSVVAGLAFLLLVPLAPVMIGLSDHSPMLQELEITYFQCLCFAGLPLLLTATASSFFSGRGDSRTVLWINGVGLVTNAVLDYLWIFGYGGFPAWGMAGAGWATVAGCWASAVFALLMMFRARYRDEYATLSGWRLEPALLGRMLWFGLPSGLQWMLDGLAFTLFIMLIGNLGNVEMAATTLAVTLNLVAFMPTMGIGQAVTILVGQRLGADQPDLAERTAWTGMRQAWLMMTAVALLYVLVPDLLMWPFRSESGSAKWEDLADLVPVLLRFVAVYCLFDSINIVLSFALKGAGDTRFVTYVSLTLSWPMLVVPTYFAWSERWGVLWAWAFASVYIITQTGVFYWRFRGGQWKSMRVIESAPVPEAALTPVPAAEYETASPPLQDLALSTRLQSNEEI